MGKTMLGLKLWHEKGRQPALRYLSLALQDYYRISMHTTTA